MNAEWGFASTELPGGNILLYLARSASGPLTHIEALRQLESSEDFRAAFIRVLHNVPFQAFRWETPPLTTATLDQPFQFVCIDSPWLQMAPDLVSFRRQFSQAGPGEILAFDNLGGDAVLVVPSPVTGAEDFSHLAAFTRSADLTTQHSFWKQVAATFAASIKEAPLWLSTAGGGVAWLHVRIDSYPKYYAYKPFRAYGAGQAQ